MSSSIGTRRVTYSDCPCCGYRQAFSVTIKDGRELFYCHAGCLQDDVLAVMRENGQSIPYRHYDPPPQKDYAAIRDYARRLWDTGIPINGTLAEAYQKSRGLAGTPLSCFRYLPSHPHKPTGTYWPTMLSRVTDIHGGLQSLHRLYLARDGKGKAAITPARMTLGPVGGYAVHLAPAAEKMAVSEGVETGLSVLRATGLPVWAALSAGGIQKLILPPLPLAREVIVCADNDANGCGQRAANAAALRWLDEGRRVRVALPPDPGTDFNDVLTDQQTGEPGHAYA